MATKTVPIQKVREIVSKVREGSIAEIVGGFSGSEAAAIIACVLETYCNIWEAAEE